MNSILPLEFEQEEQQINYYSAPSSGRPRPDAKEYSSVATMVRFEEKLASNIVDKWSKYYIDYRRLKKLLYNPANPSPNLMGGSGSYRSLGGVAASPSTNVLSLLRYGRSRGSTPRSSLASSPTGTPKFGRIPLIGSPGSNGVGYEKSAAEFTFQEGTGDPVEQHFFEIEKDGVESRWGENLFRRALLDEINKAEKFYRKLVGEVEEAYRLLKQQTEARGRSGSFDVQANMDLDLEDVNSPALLAAESLRRAFGESSKKASYLLNFCVLNYTAVVKILKKHDKVTEQSLMKTSVGVVSASKTFMAHEEIDVLIQKHERLYADFFHNGNMDLAKGDLLLKRNNQEQLIARTGARGCLYGVVSVLLIWITWDIVVDISLRGGTMIDKKFLPPNSNMTGEEAIGHWRQNEFPVYRGIMYIVFWLWCWGASLYVWEAGRVNYLYMLELDPRMSQESSAIFEMAARHTIVILALFLLHFKMMSNSLGLTGWFWEHPGIVTLILILYALWHTLRSCCGPRKSTWVIIFHTVTPCCRNVTFMMNFAGDVLTSMTKPLVDVVYLLCYSVHLSWAHSHIEEHNFCLESSLYENVTRLLLVTPYFIRFCQQVRRFVDEEESRAWKSRNIANAFKYALAMVVQLFGIFNAVTSKGFDDLLDKVWLVMIVVTTLYMYYWDLFQDWSIFESEGGDEGKRSCCQLRETRMYSRQWLYYFAALVDLFLRFFWISTILPAVGAVNNPISVIRLEWVGSVAPGLELMRRTIWSFVRLENEHLNNTAGYRRVTSIPLHFKKAAHKKPSLAENRYWQVLTEVTVISIVVIALSVTAVIIGVQTHE